MAWLLPASLAAAAAGVIALRLSWGRKGAALTIAGWSAITAAVILGAADAGAWGVAMAATIASIAALLLLAQAGWTTPAVTGRPPREAPAIALPRQELGAIARRVGVFMLVGPIGMAVSVLPAMGAGELARGAGWADADAVALVIMLHPLVWGLLASWQMLRPTRRAMIPPALLTAVVGGVMWGLA